LTRKLPTIPESGAQAASLTGTKVKSRLLQKIACLGLIFISLTQAHHRGEATDPIKYLSAPENQDLGVVKRLRKKQIPAPPLLPESDLALSNA